MTLPQIISRNQSNRIASIIRGSKVTSFGSGGNTEAPLGEGIISAYEAPVGKRARIKGVFSAIAMGSNTKMSVTLQDQTSTQIADIAVLSAVGTVAFDILVENDHVFGFSADNGADNGVASCVIEIEELPI